MEEQKPPYEPEGQHWLRWYAWVIGLLVLEIILFSLFTRHFS
jgi:hypothetical protein